ncbi:MAG: hypothetical protein M5U09_08810 [Gammaproteobacteria bacterium]|nr:hypothetical protein [Gammaproteobacteria bacterium]
MKSVVVAVFALLPAAAAASGYPVTFTTTGCDGATGWSRSTCPAYTGCSRSPCDGGVMLKQVLMRNDFGSYDAATVSDADARGLEEEIRAYTRARQEALKKGATIIVED